mmetsp:Transcript_5033/g.15079  ORF Transcript_5033/g.15079 Transcript_5033/m.15079 type:complete len:564 (-) Transcript_5033:2240-3931(-)
MNNFSEDDRQVLEAVHRGVRQRSPAVQTPSSAAEDDYYEDLMSDSESHASHSTLLMPQGKLSVLGGKVTKGAVTLTKKGGKAGISLLRGGLAREKESRSSKGSSGDKEELEDSPRGKRGILDTIASPKRVKSKGAHLLQSDNHVQTGVAQRVTSGDLPPRFEEYNKLLDGNAENCETPRAKKEHASISQETVQNRDNAEKAVPDLGVEEMDLLVESVDPSTETSSPASLNGRGRNLLRRRMRKPISEEPGAQAPARVKSPEPQKNKSPETLRRKYAEAARAKSPEALQRKSPEPVRSKSGEGWGKPSEQVRLKEGKLAAPCPAEASDDVAPPAASPPEAAAADEVETPGAEDANLLKAVPPADLEKRHGALKKAVVEEYRRRGKLKLRPRRDKGRGRDVTSDDAFGDAAAYIPGDLHDMNKDELINTAENLAKLLSESEARIMGLEKELEERESQSVEQLKALGGEILELERQQAQKHQHVNEVLDENFRSVGVVESRLDDILARHGAGVWGRRGVVSNVLWGLLDVVTNVSAFVLQYAVVKPYNFVVAVVRGDSRQQLEMRH